MDTVTVQTSDKIEAAFFWSQPGAKFVQAAPEPQRRRTINFVFTLPLTEGGLVTLRTKFYNQDAIVEPKQFIAKLQDVDNVLHEALRAARR